MKHFLFSSLIALSLLATAYAETPEKRQDNAMYSYFSKMLNREDVYFFHSKPSDIYGRFNSPAPVFIVFPDSRTSADEAEKLVDESGMHKIIDDYSGMVFFFNPLGERYDNEKDFAAYSEFINKMRIASNLKIVGIGAGATFVNETIARKAGNIAGIVSIGGNGSVKAAPGESPVPAYITGKNASKAAAAYISRDRAVMTHKNGSTRTFTNPEEPLLKVIVNATEPKDLRDVLEDSWDSLLSWNYRFNNYKHTWYVGETYGEHGDSELEPFVMFDRLCLTRNVCTEDLTGNGKFLWYEYIPQSVANAPEGSVPLVILLHGNNNDPRTQAETSGFLPLASKEGFMVAELEWQGNGWEAMGHDGIETVIYELFHKYPQIDRSRVYCEGLSAGAFNATSLGIKKTHVFAAVGAQSGGVMPQLRFGSSRETLLDEVALKRDGCDMPYFSISGSDDEAVPFPKPGHDGENHIHDAWIAYQMLNDLPVYEKLDFSLDDAFGMKLENRRHVETNKGLSYEIGDQCKNGMPLLRVVVVNGYGHWNFQPGAEVMWNFFKHFSRDIKTKKLIYHE